MQIRRSQIRNKVRVQASSQAIPATDEIIYANSAGGGFSLTLPLSTAFPGRAITIKKISSDANNVSILTSGGENIDGVTFMNLYNQYEYVTLVSRAPETSGPHWGVI